MPRRYALMGGLALLGLVVVAGVLLLVDQSNRARLADRAALDLALTRQAAAPRLTPTTADSVAISTLPASAAALLPPVQTPAASACGAGGNEAFLLALPAAATLVADGRSRQTVTVTTCAAQFVGRALNFITDGGQVNPSQILLPAMGAATTVEYTAGLSAGEIAIYGLLSDGRNEYRGEVRLTLVGEPVALAGDYDPPISVEPLTIPVTLRLVNPTTGASPSGEYVVRVYGDPSGQVMLPGGSAADAVDVTFSGGSVPGPVYYLPKANATSGTVQAYIIGRSDVPPFQATIFWSNLTDRLLFTQNWLAEQQSQPRRLKSWNTYVEQPVCLLARDARSRAITPNVLRLRYTTQELTSGILINGTAASEGLWLTAGNQIPAATPNEFGENCLTLTLPTPGVHQAGALHLEAAAERAAVQDDLYILAHQGQVKIASGSGGLTLTLEPAAVGMPAAGTLTLPPNNTLTVYRDAARSLTGTSGYLLLWADAILIDTAQGILRSSLTPITLFAGSEETPDQQPVTLALAADTPVLLLNSQTRPDGEWRQIAVLVQVPAGWTAPTAPVATAVPTGPGLPLATAGPILVPLFTETASG